MLVAQHDESVLLRLPGDGRIYSVTLQLEEVAKAVRVLVEGIEAHRERVGDRLAKIDRHALAAKLPKLVSMSRIVWPSAFFVTRLTMPPPPPRPKVKALGPLSTSTAWML